MLTIGKLGTGQERYYLDQVAQGAEDYYSGEGEEKGAWKGDAARELNLGGEVGADQLTVMLTGRNPVDGRPLVGNAGVPGRGPVPGFDLTFSAPKSVSLLWALGDPKTSAAALKAHERSIDAALTYMQSEACWTRRGKGGAEFVKGQGYLAAAFRHRSSRAGDPQLHTHVLIANATKGPDGRWRRLHHPSIYEHQKTAGYLYEAQLRHELSRTLGVRWQEVRNGIAEIAGFRGEQLRRFSTRRAEILAAAGPGASARAREVATLATRRGKDYGISGQNLRERWSERAAELGLDQATIERRVLDRALNRSAGVRAALTAGQLDRAVTARVSHFDRRGAIQAVVQSLPNGAPAAEVEQIADGYLATHHVVRLGAGPKGERFTTRRIWELEQLALATAERMRTMERGVAGQQISEQIIAARPSLRSDQRQMVERLLTGGEGLCIVIGEAGTGKSYAIASAAEGWERAGIPLRAAAPTWQAANVLAAEGVSAQSIAGLLAELDDSEARGFRTLNPGSVLLIDEAAMVDSGTLARLIAHADRADAKLVLVGDPEQLRELQAGGLFRALAERSEPIDLREVIRHRHELDVEAAKAIRQGAGVQAFELYRAEGRVLIAPDAEARREAMVAAWWQSFSRGEDALMICQRNTEVEQLNARARTLMQEQGRLGAVQIEVGGAAFAAGDHVVTRVNSPADAVSNRMRWQVAEVDAERRQVVLDAIDQERRVRLDAFFLARTNPQSGAAAIEHAYASNLYLAQGATVDRALVAAEASMSRQDYYVAMSRAREEARIYATPELRLEREEYAPRQPGMGQELDHLREAIQRDTAQIAAADEALRAPLQAMQTGELVARRAELEAQLRAEARQLEPAADASQQAKAELAMAERILAERRGHQIAADRAAPRQYVTAELGPRPEDPARRASWERGVEVIERHRQTHSIKDRQSALGAEPPSGFERAAFERTRNQLAQVRRELGLGREIGASRALEVDFGP